MRCRTKNQLLTRLFSFQASICWLQVSSVSVVFPPTLPPISVEPNLTFGGSWNTIFLFKTTPERQVARYLGGQHRATLGVGHSACGPCETASILAALPAPALECQRGEISPRRGDARDEPTVRRIQSTQRVGGPPAIRFLIVF